MIWNYNILRCCWLYINAILGSVSFWCFHWNQRSQDSLCLACIFKVGAYEKVKWNWWKVYKEREKRKNICYLYTNMVTQTILWREWRNKMCFPDIGPAPSVWETVGTRVRSFCGAENLMSQQLGIIECLYPGTEHALNYCMPRNTCPRTK